MMGVGVPPVSEQELNTGQRSGVHLHTLRVRSHLIVPHREIASRAVLVRNLHKVSAHQRPSDLHVMPGLVLV